MGRKAVVNMFFIFVLVTLCVASMPPRAEIENEGDSMKYLVLLKKTATQQDIMFHNQYVMRRLQDHEESTPRWFSFESDGDVVYGYSAIFPSVNQIVSGFAE